MPYFRERGIYMQLSGKELEDEFHRQDTENANGGAGLGNDNALYPLVNIGFASRILSRRLL